LFTIVEDALIFNKEWVGMLSCKFVMSGSINSEVSEL